MPQHPVDVLQTYLQSMAGAQKAAGAGVPTADQSDLFKMLGMQQDEKASARTADIQQQGVDTNQFLAELEQTEHRDKEERAKLEWGAGADKRKEEQNLLKAQTAKYLAEAQEIEGGAGQFIAMTKGAREMYEFMANQEFLGQAPSGTAREYLTEYVIMMKQALNSIKGKKVTLTPEELAKLNIIRGKPPTETPQGESTGSQALDIIRNAIFDGTATEEQVQIFADAITQMSNPKT